MSIAKTPTFNEVILKELINSLPVAIFAKDYSDNMGTFVTWNAYAESLWGMKTSEVLGKNDYDFFPENEAAIFQKNDRETLLSGKTLHIPQEIVSAPGGDKVVQTWKIPFFDIERGYRILLGVSMDITHIQEMEKAFFHNAKLASIGHLAAGVGHEINNPLSVIRGYINMTRKKESNMTMRVEQAFEKIDSAALKIESIVKGLRVFSRIEKSSDQTIFNLCGLLFEIENILKEILFSEGVVIEFDTKNISDNVCILGDRAKFEQILINLITNAKDATANQPSRIIKIYTYIQGAQVNISIQDNGDGISEGIIDNIFDPFFTTKEIGSGTGLGLSMVHNTLKKDFDGDIIAKNLTDETGALFTIKVPVTMGKQESEKDQVIQRNNQYRFKVILVEDGGDSRSILEEIFVELGMEVKSFSNGKKAFEEIMKNPNYYELVVSDVVMPIMSGFELVKKIRTSDCISQPKIALITGGVSLDFEDQTVEVSSLIDGYLYKPICDLKVESLIRSLFIS